MHWTFPVSNATYEVRLYFAETYDGTMGKGLRVFDVNIEGATILASYDQFADAGDWTGTMKTFLVPVRDGALDIIFQHSVQNPAIKGIEIRPTIQRLSGGAFRLFREPRREWLHGLDATYFNSAMQDYLSTNDWRTLPIPEVSRVDLGIDFTTTWWGARAPVGVTGGTELNWDNFAVQWDGYVQVDTPNLRLASRSDDGSRMWLDVNDDGTFSSSELYACQWGQGGPLLQGTVTPPLAVGRYKIRIQYYELGGENDMQLVSVPDPTVRFAYVLPSNLAAQANAASNLQLCVGYLHNWMCEQMDRNGFGGKSFRYETEPDGVTPKIHVVQIAENDAIIRGPDNSGVADRVTLAAERAGVPAGSWGETWVFIPLYHLMLPDGSLLGSGLALGGNSGSGGDDGGTWVSAERLGIMSPSSFSDSSGYGGLVAPDVGPYPMVPGVTFDGPPNATYSVVTSAFIGILAHEGLHGLGMQHDFRNAYANYGPVMATGPIGAMNGSLFPDLFPNRECHLGWAEALQLSVSRYLSPCSWTLPPPASNTTPSPRAGPAEAGGAPSGGLASVSCESSADDVRNRRASACTVDRRGAEPDQALFTDSESRPTVTIETPSGTATPVQGKLQISATASSPNGLVCAFLIENGDMLEMMPLSGTSASFTFATPDYEEDTDTYDVTVLDTRGYRGQVGVALTALPTAHHAPIADFKAWPTYVCAGETVHLTAYRPGVPNSGPVTSVRYDKDGDGVYELGPYSPTAQVGVSYPQPGTYFIRAMVADSFNVQTASRPIAIRVMAPPASVEDAGAPPLRLRLSPNPCHESLRLTYRLPSSGAVSLRIYDLSGRLIATPIEQAAVMPGEFSVPWIAVDRSGRALASGLYFCELRHGAQRLLQRFVLVH
jgi:hypothetical protein